MFYISKPYLYSNRQHEGLGVEEEAKKLKHEADHEENMKVKCTKYQCLQVRERFIVAMCTKKVSADEGTGTD
jgi:hypothetical protein